MNTQLCFYDAELLPIQEKREPIRFSPETELERLITSLDEPIPQMTAKTEAERAYYDSMVEAQRRTKGMDKIGMETFDSLVSYYIKHRQYRNAMYLILQANYGMRFSDVTRLRFCHICNADGTIKESFTLPNGELKTRKVNVYYNNNATKYIIKLFLAHSRDVTMYDYLFTSESNNSGEWLTLEQTEAKEMYGNDIDRLTVKLGKCKNADKAEQITAKIVELKRRMAEYHSESAERHIMIQQPISHETANTVILKDGLRRIGIKPLNCKRSDLPNTDIKLGTHSFRKAFGDFFYKTGFELKEKGIAEVQILDSTLMKLLQDKYMHSDSAVTQIYNEIEERAFKAICTRLDIGFAALLKATGITD